MHRTVLGILGRASFTFLFLLIGCQGPPVGTQIQSALEGDSRDAGHRPVPPLYYPVQDLRDVPQDMTALLPADFLGSTLPLWPDQQAFAADFLARHYAPWDPAVPLRPSAEAFWIRPWLKENNLFGDNRQPLSPFWLANLTEKAAFEEYPSLDQRAVTLRTVDVRTMPTRSPAFRNPSLPGEGYPFDYFQNSAVPANTPLRLRHRSGDGAWFWAEAPGVFGWFPAEDVALVDDVFVRRFRQGEMVTVIRDGVAIFDTGGVFRSTARLGSVLPLLETLPEGHRVLVAAADADRRGVVRQAVLPAGVAEPFPLPATPARVADLANRLLGQPYGWGDLHGNRDCSAVLRDLFAPFGLWLPRNSARQAETGSAVPLAHLEAEEKEKVILRAGVPLQTLIFMKGHIMLYLGEYRGRAVVMHALWGVRTRDGDGEGRRIVGRTVVTTLQPGLEIPDLALPDGDLRTRIEGMTLIGMPQAANRTGQVGKNGPAAKKRG